jgi:hypothetical protein
VKNPSYRIQADVTNQVAKYDLKRMADEGLLVPKGEKKGRYYLAGEVVKKIREQNRSPHTNPDPFKELEEVRASAQPELPGFAPRAA